MNTYIILLYEINKKFARSVEVRMKKKQEFLN